MYLLLSCVKSNSISISISLYKFLSFCQPEGIYAQRHLTLCTTEIVLICQANKRKMKLDVLREGRDTTCLKWDLKREIVDPLVPTSVTAYGLISHEA